jgi:hypothetical protein
MFVRATARGLGIGQALLGQLIDDAREAAATPSPSRAHQSCRKQQPSRRPRALRVKMSESLAVRGTRGDRPGATTLAYFGYQATALSGSDRSPRQKGLRTREATAPTARNVAKVLIVRSYDAAPALVTPPPQIDRKAVYDTQRRRVTKSTRSI